ncbi:LOW QUALITY PROTEIN: hypothetical protein ElyMa_001470900 [Elysia marginata]|uniref:Uncharacterized protein n=1 Tax=Elysia marginata TaxID=1093978 RepID=A0AAV4J3Y0_9GAST|nr:LOW QUALITY PROTEIN: hypothetical protein ElyMa_001470900 [Elysia marginata]
MSALWACRALSSTLISRTFTLVPPQALHRCGSAWVPMPQPRHDKEFEMEKFPTLVPLYLIASRLDASPASRLDASPAFRLDASLASRFDASLASRFDAPLACPSASMPRSLPASMPRSLAPLYLIAPLARSLYPLDARRCAVRLLSYGLPVRIRLLRRVRNRRWGAQPPD